VAAISESILRAMGHARDIARQLDPVSDRPDGLAHSLCAFARAVSDGRQADCRFDRRGLLVIVHDAIVAASLYRIGELAVREAIEVEHSRTVVVRLSLEGSVLELCVRGDGQGLRADRKVISAASRARLNHRAESIGATLRFDRNAQRGFTVTCSLPIRRSEELLAERRDHDE
jgi:signal transduction histidine kinase